MTPPLHPDSGISAVVLTVIRVVQVPPAERTAPRLPPLAEGEGVPLILARYSVTTHVEGLPEGEGAIAVGAFDNLIHNRVRHIFHLLFPRIVSSRPRGRGRGEGVQNSLICRSHFPIPHGQRPEEGRGRRFVRTIAHGTGNSRDLYVHWVLHGPMRGMGLGRGMGGGMGRCMRGVIATVCLA